MSSVCLGFSHQISQELWETLELKVREWRSALESPAGGNWLTPGVGILKVLPLENSPGICTFSCSSALCIQDSKFLDLHFLVYFSACKFDLEHSRCLIILWNLWFNAFYLQNSQIIKHTIFTIFDYTIPAEGIAKPPTIHAWECHGQRSLAD